MKRTYLATVAMAVGLMLTACSAISGGPSNGDIQAGAREQMLAGAGPQGSSPEFKAAVAAATVEPHGFCNSQAEPGHYVCMVKVTGAPPGQTQAGAKEFVVKLAKGTDGKWKAVD